MSAPYERKTWVENTTPLSAQNMNNIENGIEEALTKAEGNEDMWTYIRNLAYPVGSIYMSATLDTVAKVQAALGGTWEAWGQGRVPVGVNTSDSDFDTAEETGGAKTVSLTEGQLPSHYHSYDKSNTTTGGTAITVDQMPAHTHTQPFYYYNSSPQALSHSAVQSGVAIDSGQPSTGSTGNNQAHSHSISTSSVSSGNKGNGEAHPNLQPYITCYMYKRTA